MESLKRDRDRLVLPNEDPAEFDALIDDYYRQFQPRGIVESSVLDCLIHDDWVRQRTVRWIAEIHEHLDHPKAAAAIQHWTRYLANHDREHARSMEEFEAMQRSRKSKARPASPRRAANFAKTNPIPQPRRNPPPQTSTGEWIH